MTKQKAIAKKCLECSGNSAKEVTLCHLFDCPPWEYRCGYSVKTTRYTKRISGAFNRWQEELKELAQIGIATESFLPKKAKTRR